MQPRYRQTPPGFGSLVDQRDLHAEVGGQERRGVAAGPAADNDELAWLHNRKACYHKTAASQVRRAGACCCQFKERRAEDQARIEPQSNAARRVSQLDEAGVTPGNRAPQHLDRRLGLPGGMESVADHNDAVLRPEIREFDPVDRDPDISGSRQEKRSGVGHGVDCVLAGSFSPARARIPGSPSPLETKPRPS